MSLREQMEAAGLKGSPPLGGRLRELSEQAAFTITDMATWCRQHKSAMRNWMEDVDPNPVKRRYLEKDMKLLSDYLLCSETLLPVPKEVRQYDRKTYIERARADAIVKLPTSDSTRGRREVLDKHP